MAKAKSKQNLTTAKKPPIKKVRKVENPSYRSFRMHKRIKHSSGPILSAYKIMKANIVHLMGHKRLFLGISAVYFILSIVLVSGLIGATDYSVIKDAMSELFSGKGGQLTTGVTLFSVLLTGGNGANITDGGSVYQTILTIIISLVIIWALRQTYAKTKITIKDSFYKSMTPLIPFILVLLVMGLQLIPLLLGSSLYSIVISQGIAVTLIEKVLWALLVFGLVVLTLYMLASSVFALYIVTLPDVTPMTALRSARELVRYRRWSVMRKVIFLPISLFLMAAIIMIPILLYVTFAAQVVFIFLSMLALVVIHGYMYRLYRELL